MHSAFIFILMAVMATFALAAPVTSSNALVKRSFRVPLKGRPKPSPHDAMARAYAKYGWELKGCGGPSSSSQQESSNAASKGGNHSSANSSTPGSSSGGSQEGQVTATPEQNESAYVSPVSIGGQKLNLDFDTGSSDLWVFSTELQSGGQGHTLFNPAQSSSFKTYQGGSWMIQYGDGSTASGTVGFDTVNIGGATVQNQCVELAKQTNGFQSFTASDGLLGLGFSNINQVQPQQQKTFFENIKDQLDQPVFTADLGDNAAGTYEFGSIDSTKFTGQVTYTPVDNSMGFWMIQSNTFTVNGQQQSCRTCSPAVVDTGTSLMLVDDDVAAAYYGQVQGAVKGSSGYEYPCNAALPNFGVAIGNGFTATVKGSDITFAQMGSTCFGGVQPNGANGAPSLQIYGDALLKHFFVVFDGGNNQVGFANKS